MSSRPESDSPLPRGGPNQQSRGGGERAEDIGIAVPEARTDSRRQIPWVWLIPLVALIIAGWLGWHTITSQGPVVRIAFETAEGVEPGKTRIKYKDVEVGQVERVEISPDLRRILVTARMALGAGEYLRDATQFWIVRPRVGVAGVTGLGTLVSGAFIEIDPVLEGEFRREFVGLEEPPQIRSNVPGRRFVLTAERLGSVYRGAPVHHRGVEVGQVLGYELARERRDVSLIIFVRAPHERLVTQATRFWNASGVRLRTDAEGFELALASLQALIVGGIEFDTPRMVDSDAPAPENAVFTLFDDIESAHASSVTRREPFLVEFEGSTRGLRPGAPVELRGLKVGRVADVALAWREADNALVVQALIEIEPERIEPINAATGAMAPYRALDALVGRGLRAQLKIGNLLTGELFVDLDFHTEAPPAEVRQLRDYQVIPSVPTQLETLSASITGVLEKLASLPLEAVVSDLRTAIQNVSKLTGGPEIQTAVRAVAGSAKHLEDTLASAERELGPTLASLRTAADQAEEVMRQARSTLTSISGIVGSDSRIRYDLTQALKELASAARSIRIFADYLERHPEALIRGRAGGIR